MSDFSLLQAFIYLLAAVICVPIAQRLKMGSVLGYILAGIIIGPFVLGPFLGLGRGNNEELMHISEFGVVMMLFLIGLELNPREFWNMRRKIVGLGSLQLLGTILLIAFICYHFLGASFAASITVASALAISSTAIILQTLNEKGLSNTSSGKSSFSILIFQDISVIPIMAILPLLAVKSTIVTSNYTLLDGYPAWMKTIAIFGSIALVYLIGNYIVNPFFKYMARSQVRELFTSFALMLVIGVSILMEYVGLSSALGAFLAGVVLANNEYKHQLEVDIKPFKALLLGLFFISVGSSINFKVIADEPIIILLVVLGVIAIKAAVLFAIGKLYKLELNQNILFAILLSQVGEFAFVILNLGKQLQILPDKWNAVLLAVTAITMAITPILLLIYERWIAPKVKIKIEENVFENDDLSKVKNKNIIIVGYGDFGNTVGRVLKFNGYSATVLDNDITRIDLLRKLGFKVYYGDATDLDLLISAGINEADILVAAIDPPEENRKVVQLVKKHFPDLEVIIRAKNRFDAYSYLDQGFTKVYRETFFSAVEMGTDLLEMLGMPHETAKRQGEIFSKGDRASLIKLSEYQHNLEDYILASRKEIDSLKAQLSEELKNQDEDKQSE